MLKNDYFKTLKGRRVFAICKMLRYSWRLDISADKQYQLICEEGSF
jgi:hypothetical protein